MIEELIITRLVSALDVPVAAEVPAGADEYVVIQKVDGTTVNHIRNASVEIYTASTSLYNAAALNERARAAALSLVDLPEVASVNVGGERASIDTQNKRHRHHLVINLAYYE